MWSLMPLLLLLTFNGATGTIAEIAEFYEGIEAEEVNNTSWDDYIFSESEMRTHSEIERTLRHHRECRGREWSCDKRCRLEFRSDTGLCMFSFLH
ncbi:hypothetical protein KIN20_017104 [Parelaphostrongylus tenuis]|uniref:Uncharacterized protein n=1 Tax=Parelaphostrongylus tenuis TaxID=148309 RepID=A0AAD5ML17_PARTN|nr:hypothetical protein KIN20_017104 [Parelaphostrongylus tenuis]